MVDNARLMIQTPANEDNAAAAYQQVAESRVTKNMLDRFSRLGEGETITAPKKATPSQGSGNPDFDALGGDLDQTNPAAVAEGGGDVKPAAAEAETEESLGSRIINWHVNAAKAVPGILKDVRGGVVEAPGQVFGGVVDAFGEMDQFMQQVLPIGGIELFDDEGNFDVSILSNEEMLSAQGAEEDLFSMIAPDDADTVTGGFVRATAQFLTGFIPGMQATRGLSAMKAGAILQPMAAGALADMVVFDPNEDRLSTFLNQIPALSGIVPDYLADNNPDQSHWEGRLKNAIEGAGLGLATDGLLTAFRYYKAHRKAKAANKSELDPIGATVEAAKDDLKKAAREELVQDIPDTALLPLGDVADDAPLLIEAAPDEAAGAAFGRLSAARERSLKHDKDLAALETINSVRERFVKGKGVAAVDGRDPMDDMLDELRSGAVSNAKIPKRPVTAIVKSLGGIDPRSSLAGDMRSRGITAKKFPGLYRRGGRGALDNVPGSEHAIFDGRSTLDPNGYLDQQSFIDGLEAELKGEPWLTAENQKLFEDLISPLDDLDMNLDQMGIDYRTMSNDAIKARIKQIQDEEAIFARDMGPESDPGMSFDADEVIDAYRIEPVNEVDAGRVDDIVSSMENGGWSGRPILVYEGANGTMAATGSHRIAAAIKTGEDVPVIRIDDDVMYFTDAEGNALSDYIGTGDDAPLEKFLREAGDERAADLVAAEIKANEAEWGRTRNLADIEAEARLEATAQGRDPDIAAADAVKPKVFINLARVNSAEDVRAVLQEMADMDAAHITDKTRGVVSNEQTIKESSKEYRDLNDLIGRAPGPMNAAQATAARRLLASSGEQIVQLAKIAESSNASPADIFNFRRAMAVHYALQSEVVAARTETARALQAWAIPVGATKARSQAIADLIAQQGGSGDIQALAKAVSNTANNPTALNAMARELGRGRFGKALYQVWINGLLSSPKTHAVNILSNSMTALYAVPERYMAAGISKAFYNGEIETGEAAAAAFGMVKGIRDGIRLVYMGNKADGQAGLSDVFDAFAKVEGTQQNAFSSDSLGLSPDGGFGWGVDMLAKLVNAPGSALNAEDKFFKTIGYRMELQALAYRQAMSEGLDGEDAAKRIHEILSDPPDNLQVEAIDTAHHQTFTNALAPWMRQAFGGIQKAPVAGPVFRMVVPFVKTPTNILRFTFARTPLAYLSGSIQGDIKAGGARAAQAHARVALGSMIMLSVMDIASEGGITGAGPLAEDMPSTLGVRRTMRGAGGPPPYSIKVGDRWYAYNRLDPIGMLIGLGADFAEIFASADVADSEMLVAGGVLAVAQNIASKSYLSGVFDFLGAMDPSNPSSNPGKYLSDFAGSMMPYSSFLRNVAQTRDTITRDAKTVVYGEDLKVDPVATYLQETVDKMKRGIPGMSDTLPPMRDLWGEPIDKASGIGWGWDFVSPLASRADNPDPVTKEIIDNRIVISFPPREIEGVKLTSKEYDQFSELAGKGAKEYLDEFIASPAFSKLSPGPEGMKAEMIKNIINNFREQARGEMMMKNPDLRDRAISNQREKMRAFTGQ